MIVADVLPGVPNPIDLVTGTVAAGSEVLARTAVESVVGALVDGAGWVFGQVIGFVDASTSPDVQADWFSTGSGPYAVMASVAVGLLALTLLLQIGSAVWHRTGSAQLRVVINDFPRTVVLMIGTLGFTTLAIEFADALTATFTAHGFGNSSNLATSMSSVSKPAALGAGLMAMGALSGLMILAGLVLYAELLFRAGFIYVVVCFVPLGLATDIWAPMKGTAKRAIRLLAGVIMAKPIVALCMAIGASLIGSAGASSTAIPEPGTTGAGAVGGAGIAGSLGVMTTGCAVLVLAVFAPFVFLRLFPLADADATAGGRQAVGQKARHVASLALRARGRR